MRSDYVLKLPGSQVNLAESLEMNKTSFIWDITFETTI